jgi:hypothetical protein
VIPVEVEVSKTDAAVEQLDWAIRLFLDHQAYRSAVTLAGAAEEILGKAAGHRAAIGLLKSKFSDPDEPPDLNITLRRRRRHLIAIPQ